jgi:hypothetical protein
MALESATYISDLNAANPAATDGLAQADDHFRLIKGAVKATFPNVTGAINATHGALDAAATFAGAITASAAEINVLAGISAGLTSTELSVLDGITASTANLNLVGTLPVVGTLAEGSVVVGNSSSVASAVAIGASGTVLKSDGTTISWGDGTPALARGQILYGHTDGTTQVLSAGTSGQVLSSDGTDVSWTTPVTPAAGVGDGQQWYDYKGSRAVGTSYENTTGRAIMVSVASRIHYEVYLQVSADNSTWIDIGTLGGHGNITDSGASQAIVPAGHYYKATGGSILTWAELR